MWAKKYTLFMEKYSNRLLLHYRLSMTGISNSSGSEHLQNFVRNRKDMMLKVVRDA